MSGEEALISAKLFSFGLTCPRNVSHESLGIKPPKIAL